MKKVLLLFIAMCSTIFTFAQFSGSGSGTESSPYLIYNETQLSQVGNFLNQSGVYFKLMKDLDVSSFISENYPTEGWMPIGVSSSPFKGIFLGNNHKISGVWIKKTSSTNVGFWGCTNGATIQNLTIEGSSVEGADNVGALAGYVISSTISNCTISFESIKSTSYTGGMIGLAESSTLSNDKSNAGVNGVNYVGGLVGCINSTNITNSVVNGDVSGSTDVGGIVARVNGRQTISTSTFMGNLSGSSNVAGIAAELVSRSSTTFTSCYSKGGIINKGDYTGGIVGKSNGACIAAMSNCCHIGDIVGKQYIGGLIGASLNEMAASDQNVYISTSSSSNTKNATKSIKDFALSGTTEKTVNNCIAIANITGTSNIGGLIGLDEKSLSCSDWSWLGKTEIKCSYQHYVLSGDKATAYIWYNGSSQYSKTFSSSKTSSDNYWQFTFSFFPSFSMAVTTLTNSFFAGVINGTDKVGGIAGNKIGGRIQNCYSSASIYGYNKIGGIIGSAEGYLSDSHLTIKANVAINTTISATMSGLGRIYGSLGNNYVTIGALASAEGNRALATTKVILGGVTQNVADNLQHGNSVGASLLKLKATYVALGWDYNNDWDILETESYPYKKYQTAPPVIESNLVSQETQIGGSSNDGGTVFLFYKNNNPVSTTCQGNKWSFNTEPLQSGASVKLYAEVANKVPSYYTTAEVGFLGKGTESDPYKIYTAEDLQGAYKKGYYKVMNDIDLTNWIKDNSPTEGWTSVGRNVGETIYIDGDNHKISGLWINTTDDFTGLFSNFAAGEIKNLIVEVMKGKQVKGGNYTGILVGRIANGKITNCVTSGDVTGLNYVGGAIGYSESSTLKALTYIGNANSNTGSANIGGAIGYSKKDNISYVRATPCITSSGTNVCIGGLIGKTEGSTIMTSHTDPSIVASGNNSYVGGLVGYSQSTISQSYTTGNVYCSGDNSYTGGLVGYAKSGISNCYSTASATGTLHTAGLCAYTFSTIERSYALGNVSGVTYGAGVVSNLDGASAKISKCVAINNTINLSAQTAWGCRVIGGFSNGAPEPGNDNYALSTMQVSLNSVPQKKTDDNVEGIAKSATELMSNNFYSTLGWDMSSIWGIDEGTSYPYFKYMANLPIITVNASHGTITGGGSYEYGSVITLTVTPDEHYSFVKWSDGVTSSSRRIIVSGNATYTAEFKADQFTITASATNGKVIGAGTYDYGTQVTLTVTPNDHYHFVKWQDGLTTNSRDVIVEKDATYTADCAINQHTITVNGENGTTTGSGTYDYGTEVTLTATANEHFHFVKWQDGVTSTTRKIVVVKDSTYTATFSKDQFAITVKGENGTITGGGTYDYGTKVTLTAIPNEHYHFVKWSDGVTTESRVVEVKSSATYTAVFAIDTHTLSLSGINGVVNGSGTYDYGKQVQISVTPNQHYHFVKWSDGITTTTRTITISSDSTLVAECAIDQHTISVIGENGMVTGEGTYDYGTEVTLTATPNEHYHFVKWSDGITTTSRQIKVEGDKTYTAIFAIDQFTITTNGVNGTITGGGTYDYGTQVTLAATPNEHYHFVKWNDGNKNASRSITITEDMTFTAEFAIDQFTITVNSENGIVTGGGTYDYGTKVTLTATPNAHYHFVKWNDGNVNITRNITVTEDVSFTAEFAIDQFTITASGVNGTVTGTGTYDYGTQVTLTATPNAHYHFVKWSDGNVNTSRNITVTEDVSFTAEFAIDQFTITASGVNGTVTGGGTYDYGTKVTLTATPNEHYHFVKWNDGNINASRSVTITEDMIFTAEFTIDQFTITASGANGTVTGGGTYDYGTQVTLTATPNAHYHFVKWSDGNTSASRSITVTENQTFTAVFAIDQFEITVSAVNGTVTGGGTYDYGTQITLTAIPDAHYHFTKWSDGVTTISRQITVEGNKTYTAEFAIDQFTISASGTNGTFTGTGTYDYGTQITLTAVPNAHYHFVQWGDGNTNASRSITVTENQSFTAVFAIDQFEITVSAVNGTVSGGGTYDYGKQVTLTAIPDAHYHFTKWSDGVTTISRQITVEGNKTYTAEFAIDQFTISASGTNGTFTGTGTYDYGTQITLTAVPNAHYHFVQWGDGNTNASRSITVTENQSFTAVFAIDQFEITVSAVNGTVTGGGTYDYGKQVVLTVTPNTNMQFASWQDGNTTNPRIITVTANATYVATCSAIQYTITAKPLNATMGSVSGSGTYDAGSEVYLVATANTGYEFTEWADGDKTNPRLITVTKTTQYVAKFAAKQFTVTVLSADDTMGSVTGDGTYAYNTSATLTATANEGYSFQSWDDGNSDNPRTLLVTEDVTLIATFAPVTGLDDINAEKVIRKIIKDGQLLILRDGKTYNAQGTEL